VTKAVDSLVEAYETLGLSRDFASAIAKGGDSDAIIRTWKAEWREGLPESHPAVKAVLNGNASPEEAGKLVECSEDHPELIQLVADGKKTVRWVVAVLDAFHGQHSAVSAVIGGADPSVAANFLGIEVEKKILSEIKKGGAPIEPIKEKISEIRSNIRKHKSNFKNFRTDAQKERLREFGLPISGNKQERDGKFIRFIDLLALLCLNSMDGSIKIKGESVKKEGEPGSCPTCLNGGRGNVRSWSSRRYNRSKTIFSCTVCRTTTTDQLPRKIGPISDITNTSNFDSVTFALAFRKNISRVQRLAKLKQYCKKLGFPLMLKISSNNKDISRTSSYTKGSSDFQKSDF